MKKNKGNKITTLIMVALLTLCLSACGKGNSGTDGSTGTNDTTTNSDPYTIGFSNLNDIYPYCIKFRDYLVELAEAEGMKVLIADASGDANTQNGQIDNFIMQGVDIVTAISIDLDASIPAVKAAENAGIPFISYLTNVRDDGGYDKYIYIGSENYDAGVLQGKYLAEVLPKDAKILYQTGNTGDSQYNLRKQGLIDGLADRTDVTIAAEICTMNQKDKGITAMEDWMQTYDKIDCVVAQNDDSILGAIEAMKSANRLEGVITVGLDGSDDALASIKAGELTMTVLQDAKGQAEAAIEIFKKLRDGEDAASIEDAHVPFQTITIDNMADYE